ncbi:pyruvate carboxylase [Phocea massiliensis]|uniref:Pyruvate carboxylase n=1 Tax=uncultured Anaerotruncus sp. TaxID=905011 RepID=A0A6N2T9R3_9FIRM|nr:pyruvate carboxylase [Merdimmobilis hominis]MCD4835858.1 pyruvate carboxylase [Merdimmobilis hominis]
MQKQIKKVLVANRGEIAIRVFRACYDLGLSTVAIYSKEDKYNLFRTKADESYLIGETKSPLGAYLAIDEIIRLAKRKGVDAIHPGYGFLSENADFARACEEAGLIFIGPPSSVLASMGDKLSAKEIALRCGVPTIPGTTEPLASLEDALQKASEYGYPVILKASAGGGGRGMRRANTPQELADAFQLVKNESRKAFGSEDIFLEKYLENPKHIEVQILADQYGNIVHLYERDCSVQRRYQKVVEFTPAFTLPEELRREIHSDAVKIAREAGYVNAGTVEFLVAADGRHYFIEMNPRIQVEHTVTEMVTGIDIVKAQINIAQGLPLSDPSIGIPSQEAVSQRGYAIQCRITTEDPRNNFAPDTGKITTYRSGGGFGVRLDAGNAFTGAEITPYYDSLLVKITTFDNTFEGTARKMLRAIAEIRIRGVKTNMSFLNNILTHPVFLSGRCHTKFIDDTPELFATTESKDRATKVLKYLGNIIIQNPEAPERTYEAPRVPDFTDVPRPTGLKQYLDQHGPEGLKDWILSQKKLLITDTTLRDAHQSLLATRVRSRDLITIADATSYILNGAFSLEMWGGATFDVAYRFLHESPWERLDELRRRIPNIPFQMLIRGANAVGYTNYPDNVIKEFIREAARSGIDIFRVFDALNWIPGMELTLEEVAAAGKVAEASICYTGDILDPKEDKYPLQYYVNLAKELEKRGAHILCIKDMGGLLKPYAAKKLVKTLKEEVGLPIHLHTHDTSGNQIAALLLAAEAGVDIVDTAISSLSSLTSQPSMNSLVYALQNGERDTGFDPAELQKLSNYWADVRKFYQEFEADIHTPETEIYRYEIPGGQYTNLKPQVESLGLGHRFDEVKEMFRTANLLLGNLIKVTPSSKMVGDLAIFMVQNGLTPENILERGRDLTFPDSVIGYFKGMIGHPQGGFPKELQEVVLKGEEPITCRPGELLPPADFEAIRAKLEEFYPNPTNRDIIGYCLYPKVMEDFLRYRETYGDISRMTTPAFFGGLTRGETTELAIEDGKTLIIKYIGPGELNADGTRFLQFELNGARRDIAVEDKTAPAAQEHVRLADLSDQSQVGSSIPGAVSKVLVKPGDKVEENQVLAIIEAMKMETSVCARMGGTVKEILVKEGQSVKAGELLITIQ